MLEDDVETTLIEEQMPVDENCFITPIASVCSSQLAVTLTPDMHDRQEFAPTRWC